MQRPRQHVIETESKKGMEQLIPDNWVVRELSPDYGLDFMVEIFEGANSTGKIFYLQLKGTDQQIKDDKVSYQLKIEHIEYYNSIPTPVLFVMYSTTTKQTWGIWSNALKDVLVEEGDDQKTYLLNFDKRHLVDKGFFTELEKSFTPGLPKKANITFESATERGKAFHLQLVKWIEYYFGPYIEIENNALPSTLQFRYEEVLPDQLRIALVCNRKEFELAPVDLTKDNFLYLPVLDKRHPARQLNEALIIVAYQLYPYDIRRAIEILKLNLHVYDGDLLPPIGLIEMVKAAIEAKAILEIQQLSKKAIEARRMDLFEMINAAILFCNSDGSLSDLYQENLLFAIAGMREDDIPGFVCYNIANSFRSTGDYYSASKYYQLARKNEPDYLNRSYWWTEYAGVLFLTSHYCLAERFYRKSLALDPGFRVPLIYCLLGDSLFFQGKFTVAQSEFDKFLQHESQFPKGEAFLKRQVCENFILAKLDNIAFDIPRSMALGQQAIEEKSEDKLGEAIAAYPLNGWAWFNLGVLFSDEGREKECFTAFLTAACVQDWDREAWKNCFFISMNQRNMTGLAYILETMLDKFSPEVVNYMALDILQDPKLPQEAKKALVEAMGKLIPGN